MLAQPLSDPHCDEIRAELGRLRVQVECLSAELAEMRRHAADLEVLAHEDPLTGVHNRRGFMRELSRAVAYRARYGTPVALLIVDLDHFKPINDRYGHTVGDRALAHAAAVLRGSVRASDSIGRLGGDEFALILWQVDPHSAERKARALERIVETSPLTVEGEVLRLAVSVGVVMIEPRDAPEIILAKADAAMYARKAERRSGP